MCTREELKTEIEAVEKRIEAQMQECREEVDQQIFKSHNSIAAVQSQNGAALKELTGKVDNLAKWFREHDIKEKEYQSKVDAHLSQKQLSQENVEKLVDMVQDYTEKKVLEKSVNKLKNMLIGFAGVCAAVGVIITSVIALIKSIK